MPVSRNVLSEGCSVSSLFSCLRSRLHDRNSAFCRLSSRQSLEELEQSGFRTAVRRAARFEPRSFRSASPQPSMLQLLGAVAFTASHVIPTIRFRRDGTGMAFRPHFCDTARMEPARLFTPAPRGLLFYLSMSTAFWSCGSLAGSPIVSSSFSLSDNSTLTSGVMQDSEILTPAGVNHLATVIFSDAPFDRFSSSWTEPLPKVFSPTMRVRLLSCNAPANISEAEAEPLLTRMTAGYFLSWLWPSEVK